LRCYTLKWLHPRVVKFSNDRILRSLRLRAIAFLNYYNLAFLHPWERFSKSSRQRIARSRVHFAVTAKDLTDCPVTPRCYSDKLRREKEKKKEREREREGERERERKKNREDFLESALRDPGRFKRGRVTAKFNICGRATRLCLQWRQWIRRRRRRHNFCNIPEFYVREFKRVLECKCYQANSCFSKLALWPSLSSIW